MGRSPFLLLARGSGEEREGVALWSQAGGPLVCGRCGFVPEPIQVGWVLGPSGPGRAQSYLGNRSSLLAYQMIVKASTLKAFGKFCFFFLIFLCI